MGNIYREINRLEKWKSFLSFRQTLAHGHYWGYACYLNKGDKSGRGREGFIRIQKDKAEKRFVKDNPQPQKYDELWYAKRDKAFEKAKWPFRKLPNYVDEIKEVEKKINRLKIQKYNIIGKSKKANVGRNLAQLVVGVCREKLSEMRFCSPTGREVKVSLKMFKPELIENRNSWYYNRFDIKEAEPKTPAEIALYRMKGYIFDAELDRYTNGHQRCYQPTLTNRGLLYYAEKNPQQIEWVKKANAFKKRIKDTIFCKYMDSHKKSRYSLKFKDMYLYQVSGKWVDKKKLKIKKVFDTFAKALPEDDFINKGYYEMENVLVDLVKNKVKERKNKVTNTVNELLAEKIKQIKEAKENENNKSK